MTKRALLVGIDNYGNPALNLGGCVADVDAMKTLLARHADLAPNYDCEVLTADVADGTRVTKADLRKACRRLFEYDGDVLLYYSGHGYLSDTGGLFATSDAREDDWGVPMQEVMQHATKSDARNILLILDCCHSGDTANAALFNASGQGSPLAVLRENLTVLAASRDREPSIESNGHGLFTTCVLHALDGGAADHLGFVTAASIYTYVERRLGAWDQRPIYKAHTTTLPVIRECAPLIQRFKLHELVKHFPAADLKFQLDPEYEPEDENGNVHEPVNQGKVQIARLFKEYRDAGLLKPSDPEEQLYWTARRSKTVELTLRGREYWRLVKNGRI